MLNSSSASPSAVSATNSPIYYLPKWYQIGDADDTVMAILYGLISVATIWRVEDLAELWLFRNDNRLSLSDLRALITFRSSSLIEMVGWFCTRPEGTRVSRKALTGTILRLLIYFVEVMILVGSIPRTISVYESQVSGTTELSFLQGSALIDQDSLTNISLLYRSCNTDKTPYIGFNPTALRQICRSTATVPEKSLSGFDRISKNLPNNTELYMINHRKDFATLDIIAFRSRVGFSYSHSLTFKNEPRENRPYTTVQFSLPQDIIEQASNTILRTELKTACTKLNTRLPDTALFLCPFTSNYTNIEILPYVLTDHIGTRKVNGSVKKLVGIGDYSETNLILGEVNRPRLCLFPALLLLAVLLILSILSRMKFSGTNPTLMMWKLLCEVSNSENNENPVYVHQNTLSSAGQINIRENINTVPPSQMSDIIAY